MKTELNRAAEPTPTIGFGPASESTSALAYQHAPTMQWALERLARLRGLSLDLLRLRAALENVAGETSIVQALQSVCGSLNVEPAWLVTTPDPARIPALCFVDSIGWGVVEAYLPDGTWQVSSEQNGEQKTTVLATPQLIRSMFSLRLISHRGLDGANLLVDGPNAQTSQQTFKSVFNGALRGHRSVIYEGVFATLFIGLLTLGISLFSMQVYDRVIPTRSDATLVTLGVGVGLAIMLELIMKLARSRMMDSVAAGTDTTVSREIFSRLMSVRIDQLPGSVGSLASQIRGYEQVRTFYTGSTLFMLVDLPLGLLMLLIIAMIATPALAVVPLAFSVVAIALGWVVRKRIIRLAAQGAQASNYKTGLLVEAVEGAETIKAGAGSWKFLSRWIDVNSRSIKNDLQMRHTNETMSYLAAAIQQSSYACLIAVGAWVVMQGQMTIGALIACSILSGRIMTPILSIPSLMTQHAHARAAAAGLEQLYALKTDNHQVAQPLIPTQLNGHFVLSKIEFAYPNGPTALRIEQLEIKPGERVAILGAIGAGKSTLLRILAGIYQPQSGKVCVDGLDLAQISRPVVSQHIGYLQQDHRLFQGTLRENLLIGLPDPGDDALRAAMTRSGLIKLVSNHPKGLDLTIAEGGSGLSGGQRQLVAFTRLLLCQSAVLLLDEPTASMDDEQERRCLNVLKDEINIGKTMIVVTHKMSILPLIDRLIVVNGSEVVMDGPRDVVIARLSGAGQTNQRQTVVNPVAVNPPAPSMVLAPTLIRPTPIVTTNPLGTI